MEQTPPNQQQFQAYQAALAAQQYGYGMPGGFQGSMAAAGQHQGYGGWQHSQAPPTGPGYMDHSLHGQQLGHWEVIKSRGFAIMSGRRAQNDVGALMAAVQSARQFPGWPDTFNAWFRTDDTLWGIEGSDNTYSWLIKSVALSLAQAGDVKTFTKLAACGLIPSSGNVVNWTSEHPAIRTLELFLRNKAWSLLLLIAKVDPEAVYAYESHISDARLLHVCARSDMPPQHLQSLVQLLVQPRPNISCWWLLLDAFTTLPDALTAAYMSGDMGSVDKLLPIWRFATSYWPPIQGDEQPPCSLIVWHAAAAGDAAMVQRVIDRMVQAGEISSAACHIDIMYNGATPLMMAVKGGHTSIADVLVAAGADPYTVCRTPQQASPAANTNSAKGSKGRAGGRQKGGRGGGGAAAAAAPASAASWYTTPMHAAAASGSLPLLAALLRTQLAAPQLSPNGPVALPDSEDTDIPAQGYGSSVWRRSQDQVGDTPLTAALRAGRGPCAAALVEAGWSPFQVLRCGQPLKIVTPLLLGVQVATGRTGLEPFFEAAVQRISAELLVILVFPVALTANTSATDQQLLGRWLLNQGRAISDNVAALTQQQAEQLLQQAASWEALIALLQPSLGLSKWLGSSGQLDQKVLQAAVRLYDGGRSKDHMELVLLGAVKARCLPLVELLVGLGQVSPHSVCKKVVWEDFSISAAYSSRCVDASSGSSKQLDAGVWWTTPLHAAVTQGHQDMVKCMVAASSEKPPADLPWGTEEGWKPSKAKQGALAADDGCGDSPLTLAVRGGHAGIAAVLLGKGWDPYRLVQWKPPEGGSGKCQHAILLAAQAGDRAKKFAGFSDLVLRDFQVLRHLKALLLPDQFTASEQQSLATWLRSHEAAWQGQQKITGEEAQQLMTILNWSSSALLVLLSPCCGLREVLDNEPSRKLELLRSIFCNGTQQLLEIMLTQATWLLTEIRDLKQCGEAVSTLPLHFLQQLLAAGMRPDMEVVMKASVWPLSQAVLYLDVRAVELLLETGEPAVITAQRHDSGDNLIHAVVKADWKQEKFRAAMLEMVLGKAVQLGCVSVFTTKDNDGKVPHTCVRNAKVSESIRTAEARARKKALAAKEAAREAARQAAGASKKKEKAARGSGSEDWEHKADSSSAAKSKQGGKRKQRQEPVETPLEACKKRVGSMLGLLPEALQRVAAGTAGPLAPSAAGGDSAVDAAAAEADSRRAAARQRRKQQAALQQRLTDIAPEQLPHKDASLSEGRQPAAAPAPAPAVGEEEVDPEEDEEEAEREAEAAAAAGEGAGAGLAEDDVGLCDVGETILEGLHWEFTITRDAMASWAALDSKYRRLVALKLRRIGEGCWRTDGDTKKLRTQEPGLELWRTKFTRGGRLVWQVAVDYSSRQHVWVEMVRLWAVKLSHKKYMVTLTDDMDKIEASHRRSQQVRQRLQLRPLGTGNAGLAAAGGAAQVRLPQVYQPLADDEDAQAVLPEVGGGQDVLAQQLARAAGRQRQAQQQERGGDGEGNLVEHLPPANGGEDVFTLLKMYSISPSLMRAMLTGQTEDQVDFPFRVSEAEMRIIELEPRPPASILLLGRSGTGKTTVLVFRLFAAWLSAYQHTHTHQHCVFVTASATLKEQVAKTFRKLQAAAVTNADDAAAIAAATATDPVTLRGLPSAAFPLFTTTRQWLQLLDASCAEPFFARTADGALLAEGGRVEAADWDGIGLGVDLGGWGSDEEDEEEGGREEDVAPAEGDLQEQEDGLEGAGQAGPARGQEITYAEFVSPAFWGRITRALGRQSFSKEQRAAMRAPLVYQEIMSYIKGSAEALEAGGSLSLAQYKELGAKRAPNFSGELRDVVYAAYTAYESTKNAQGGWDRCDLAAHLYQQLVGEGYQGVPLDGVYRDEVQDFTQAELLLDLRVCADPNAMFYCGDTCQTIARGIGFRFEDVKTLLYSEGKRRETAGLTRGIRVGVPGVELLKVNYRTHSGILDPASAVTSCIKELFPRFLDKAPRERAFFAGPKPVLLGALTVEDLSILLSSGDPGASQVEFGAHQVVLVRDMSALEQLPSELTNSNALIMTVGQSKGLEFDDVFIVNFFGDSPCTPEWRVLMTLLDKAREGTMEVPAGVTWTEVVKAAEEAGALRPLDFDERQHSQLCEELKHLYVAITRAKNNLVFFDQDPAKRAPFYHFLRCLGLATYMKSGLGMSDPGAPTAAEGASSSSGDPAAGGFKSSLSNTPAEWAKRAKNLTNSGMFHLVVQCYRQAGDAVRAAAFEAVQQVKEVSGAPGATAEARGTSKPSGRKHLSQMSKAERQEFLAPIAHQLLACAVQGGFGHAGAAANLPGPPNGTSSKPLIEPLDVPGAVAPPLTPAEQTGWLKLAAQVLQKAGWPLEAGRVLLVMGPEHVPAARRVMSTVPKAEAARLYENMVRAELLGSAAADNTTASGSGSSSTNSGEIRPLQLQGSFMAAAAALKEAFCLYRDGGEPGECWRLLQEYQPLQDVLPPDDQDRALLAYCNQLGRAGQREAFLAAAGKLHKKSDREQLLRQHGFWRELAAELKDPVEASRLLAAHKDYLAAAQRLLAGGVDRLTLGQLQQVHSWLLSVQSVEAAEGAINMWHEVPPKRFEAASQHELVLAECRLHLGRLLLREACGQTVPALTVDRPVKDAEAGPSSNAQDDKAAAAPSSKTSNSSWAQVAASTAPTAAGGSKGSAAADKLLPTAFLQHLPDVLAAHPERQEQVDRALQMLAAAAAGFSAADRSPGVVEALSWSLAAKGLGSVTTSHHQVAEGDAPDALEAVQAAYRGRQLLQSLLQDLARCIPELKLHRYDKIPEATEGDHWSLTALEEYYGALPLKNNKQQTPVEVRDSNPQLLEALAALDPDVTRFLTPGTAGTHSASVTYPTACQALTAHLAKHMAGMLQLCLSAAVQQLQRMEWMGTWVQVAAGAVREAAVEQSLRQALRIAVLALALAHQMHQLQLVLRITAPSSSLLNASTAAPYSALRKHLVLLLVGLEAQPLPLPEWNIAAEFKRAYTQLPLADILPFKNVDGITKEVVGSILNNMPKKLLVADPAAGYWQLRSQHLQHVQPEATNFMTLLQRQETLRKHWYHQAGDVYRDDPVHTQLLLQWSTGRGSQHMPDVQFLLDAESKWGQNAAGQAVQMAVDWLQRSLTKEQLAAGLAGSETDDSFASVQPLPVDVAVQQVQLALGTVVVGQMVSGGRASCFLPSWAVALLHNPAQSPCWADVTVADVAPAWRNISPKLHAELAQQVLGVLHQLVAYHWPMLLQQKAVGSSSSGTGQQEPSKPPSGSKARPAMLFAERVPALLGDTAAAVLAASGHTQGGASRSLQLLGPLASHLVLLLGCAVFTWTTGAQAPQQLPTAAVLVMRRLVDLALAAVQACEPAEQQTAGAGGTAAAPAAPGVASSSSSWRVVKPLLQLQEQLGRLIAAAVAAAPPGTAQELERPGWPLAAAPEGAAWVPAWFRSFFSGSSSSDAKPAEQQGIARVKAGAWADVLVQLAEALGGTVVQVMPGSYREVMFQGCSSGRSLELNRPPAIPIRISLDAATLSQVRTMLMPVRREAVQLQKRLTRQELEAAKQERLRQELAAEEARKEAARKLKASSWFMERCRSAIAAARQRIQARRSAIEAAAAAGAHAAAATLAGMPGGAAGGPAAGSLIGYINSIMGWLGRAQEALQGCIAGNFLTDATCPVCPQHAANSRSQQQEQQVMAAAAVTVAGALSGLSAGAREFQQHGSKAVHLESYQQYLAFCQHVQVHVLPAYAAAARHGDVAGQLVSSAAADMPVQLQRVQLRYSGLINAAEALFEDVKGLIEARAWGKAASLNMPLHTLGSALQELQQDLQPLMQAFQQQQQQQRAQPTSYAAAAAGAMQQHNGLAGAASGNVDAAAAAATAAGVYESSHLEQQWAQGAGPASQEVWVTPSAATTEAATSSPSVAGAAYQAASPGTAAAGVVSPSPAEVHMPSLLGMWQAAGAGGVGLPSPGTPAPSGQQRVPIYLASPGPSPLDLTSAASGSMLGPDTPGVTPGAALGDEGEEDGAMAMPDASDMLAFLQGMQAADGGAEADAKEAAADAEAEAEETFDLDGFQVVSNRRRPKKVKEGAQPYSAAGAAGARGQPRGAPHGGGGGRAGGGAAAGGGRGRRR